MKFKILYIILSIIISFPAVSQEKLSLSDALKICLENNYQIRVSAKNVEIASNNNTWGNAGRYPSLSLSLNQINRFDDSSLKDEDPSTESMLNSLSPGLNLGWNLFNGFAVNISKKSFAALHELSEGNEALIVENSLQSVILAYYKVLLEKEKLEVINELVKLSKDRYDYLLMKKDLGNAVTYDVLQAKNSFLSDSATVLMQQMNLRSAETTLNLLLGVAAGSKYELTENFEIPVNDFVFSDLLAQMKSDNKTLKNQYINQKLLSYSTDMSKTSLYPNLYLNAGTDYGNSSMKIGEMSRATNSTFDYYVNFSISYNLFNGGKVKTAIKNARIQEEIASIQVSELEHTMENALITLYDFYNIRKKLLFLSEENLKSSKLNLDISEEKFKAGTINSFNYRDIQILYLNTAFSNLEAIYNLLDTNTELLRITGGIINEYQGI